MSAQTQPPNQPRPVRDVPSDSESDTDSEDGHCSDWVSSQGEVQRTVDLFDPAVVHPTADAALDAARKAGFDLAEVSKRLGLDLYGRMRLINWIRQEHPSAADIARLTPEDEELRDDTLLAPVIPDDPLLQYDFDGDWSDDEDEVAPSAAPAQDRSVPAVGAGADEIERLRAEVQALRAIVNRTVVEDEDEAQAVKRAIKGKGKERDDDTHYFDSYADNDIHEIMLRDTTRTVSYARFLLSNPAVFQGAVVLDVGAGTGILSMLAARAGAKHVYAIEASGLAAKTRENVRNNGLEGVITVIQGKVEDITLPVDTVDVIVSEWMGYMLLYESMLDSVLHARDRFLAPGGLMAPSQTRLVISAITGDRLWKERVTFWESVYGFDMTTMTGPYFSEGLVEIVNRAEVVTSECVVRDINSHDATPASLDFISDFAIESTATETVTVRSFLTHFDTFFSPVPGTAGHLGANHEVHIREFAENLIDSPVDPVNAADANVISFTTGPRGQPTHWKQVAFLLRKPVSLAPGQSIVGKFFCKKSPDNSRELDVEIHFAVVDAGKQAEQAQLTIQTFKVR